MAPRPNFGCGPKGCGRTDDAVKFGKSAGPLAVVGLNYLTAPADVRAKLAIAADERVGFLQELQAIGFGECAVLSTCNRTEVYLVGGRLSDVVGLLSSRSGIPASELAEHLYEKHCVCAACHLFRVTSGLDSVVLGETEIVAQVKEAQRAAEAAGTFGAGLALAFRRAMEASKRVRTETEIASSVTSTATLAVRVARQRLGVLRQRRALVLGAGPIAERILKELRAEGVQGTVVLNRTLANASAIVTGNEKAMGLDCLDAEVAEADVVFSALGGGSLDAGEVAALRRGRPLLVLDMGMPPNFRGTADSVTQVGIDDLTRECEANLGLRTSAIPAALGIIEEEVARFTKALAEREAAPTIRALVHHGNQIRRQNLDWAKERLPSLSDKEMRVVEEMARRMMIGLLESPIESLKGELSAQEHRHVVERLFALEGNEDA